MRWWMVLALSRFVCRILPLLWQHNQGLFERDWWCLLPWRQIFQRIQMMWRGKKCRWPELQDVTHTSCTSQQCPQKYKNLHFPDVVLFTIVGFEPELLQCLLNSSWFWVNYKTFQAVGYVAADGPWYTLKSIWLFGKRKVFTLHLIYT